eukprot:08383.XXX_325436_327840_1 [CDS] Oithona nana genome sequencing.
MEDPTDRPIFDPGDIVESPNGDLCVRIIEHIGEGRCCMVYSAKTLRDNAKVALKVFKKGSSYDGAVQREQYILDLFNESKHNIVMSFGQFLYKGLHCQVMELLECNIRSVIFKNERQGLSPWATQKFARDVLTALASLHQSHFVHADLKPANIMWSSYDGRFKVLDFGLTFHTDEEDLHQIQSPGYKAPEVAEWNKYKDEMKKRRKRKLQGTYSDLTKAAPAYERGLQNIGVQGSAPVVVPISDSPIPSGASRTILRAPPRRNRLSGVFSASSDQDRESIIVLDEYQRHSRRGSNNSVASNGCTDHSKAIADAAAAVTAACNKWLSESSGIFTESAQTGSSTNSVLPCETTATATTTSGSVTTSTILSSDTSSMNVYEDQDGQEWRRGRTKTRNKGKQCKQPRPTSVCAALAEKEKPLLPNESSDMWSFGCLLAEVLSGTKMFSATDKMASVLKPHQLVEMRLGSTEIKYHEIQQDSFFKDAKDLISRCLDEDPSSRCKASQALNHPFFQDHVLMPTTKDMVILPSHILQLYNVFKDEKYKDPKELEDAIRDIRETAEEYGKIMSMSAKNGHAYIEFQEASDCQEACAGLTGKRFDEIIVFALFYPISLWNQKIFT